MASLDVLRKESDVLRPMRNVVMYPLTDEPITLPQSAIWNYIALEHHQQPPGECTYLLPYHTIRIALRPYNPFERRSNNGRLFHDSVIRGDLALCPASSQQWMRWQANADFLLLSLHPRLLIHLAEEAGLSPESIELLVNEQEIQDPLLFQIGLALLAEISEAPATLSAMYVETLANTLGAHLLKQYCQYPGRTIVTFPPAEQLSAIALQRVTDYIQTYLDHALPITELAEVIGMSPYHFARCFKQSTGLSPHQHILRERIEYAKTRLLEEEPIIDLGARLGFADQSHFTRSFKHFVGMTPAAFVRHHRKHFLSINGQRDT